MRNFVSKSHGPPPSRLCHSHQHQPPNYHHANISNRFNTPNLTPISNRPEIPTITSNTNRQYPSTSAKKNSIKFYSPICTSSPQIVARARTVAARLYYEPTPESVPPNLDNDDLLNPPPLATKSSFDVSGCGSEIGAFFTSFKDKGSNTGATNASGYNNISAKIVRSNSAPAQQIQGGVLASIRHAHSSQSVKPSDSTMQQQIHKNDVDIDVSNHHASNSDIHVQNILTLLCTLGTAYKLLCHYQCKESLSVFHKLPYEQFHTGWVQHHIGKAYFEMANYPKAKQALEYMKLIEPHRVKGLDILSTAYWHLKHEIELCHLAQHVTNFDRLSPETWVVVGNCFSLQKEHETAILFFKRSIQLDPSFKYAYTLSGHEYISNEDLDSALLLYRNSIRFNERYYNAWYGLGTIYFRQEKYDLAEYHFTKALSIHPRSSVLQGHLGIAQHANSKPLEALRTLELALVHEPKNVQARFHRATIFNQFSRYQESLQELEKVRNIVPKEASVYFAMGKIYKKLNDIPTAMRCFLCALDLESKDNNLIKAAIDRLDVPDDIEEDENDCINQSIAEEI